MRGGHFVPANAGETFRYVTCPGMRGAHTHYRLRVVPGHHPGITRGRVNLAAPARRGVPRPRPPGRSAIQTDNSVSVQSQLIAVPRPTGPRVPRAVLLRRLESAALQHGTAPLSAPIVDEFRSPAAAAWVAFLHGDLVSAEAALDRAAEAAAEHHAVTYGVGQVLANLAAAGIHLERRWRLWPRRAWP